MAYNGLLAASNRLALPKENSCLDLELLVGAWLISTEVETIIDIFAVLGE
jgi:hypothetical protein